MSEEKLVLMTEKEIQEEIDFEDDCGVNTLLQHIFSINGEFKVYKKINNKGENCGWEIK